MTPRVRDYLPLLREAISEARAAGIGAAADELEHMVSLPFTTSSEMLQEHGIAIRRFLEAAHGALADSTRRKLRTCLNETELAAPGWRGLIARLRRPGVLR